MHQHHGKCYTKIEVITDIQIPYVPLNMVTIWSTPTSSFINIWLKILSDMNLPGNKHRITMPCLCLVYTVTKHGMKHGSYQVYYDHASLGIIRTLLHQ